MNFIFKTANDLSIIFSAKAIEESTMYEIDIFSHMESIGSCSQDLQYQKPFHSTFGAAQKTILLCHVMLL